MTNCDFQRLTNKQFKLIMYHIAVLLKANETWLENLNVIVLGLIFNLQNFHFLHYMCSKYIYLTKSFSLTDRAVIINPGLQVVPEVHSN